MGEESVSFKVTSEQATVLLAGRGRLDEQQFPWWLCTQCGWSDQLTVAFVQADGRHGPIECPACRSFSTVVVRKSRPRIEVDLGTALRDAGLSSVQLRALADVLDAAAPDASPRDVAEAAPFASNLITVASRVGDKWLPTLLAIVGLVLTVYFGQQAHVDAQQASGGQDQPAAVQNTAQLTEQHLADLARRAAAHLDPKDALTPEPPEQHRGVGGR